MSNSKIRGEYEQLFSNFINQTARAYPEHNAKAIELREKLRKWFDDRAENQFYDVDLKIATAIEKEFNDLVAEVTTLERAERVDLLGQINTLIGVSAGTPSWENINTAYILAQTQSYSDVYVETQLKNRVENGIIKRSCADRILNDLKRIVRL